ncbi:TetR/AcrR family transcriptional regulator [Agrococcus sp. ARC_14]|uniref:TetR/AcrR family transcriptional regulator n=1 Tax=Agrococcus sp. ARC_14 TaxID=2919927 RepID=UPI001F06E32A|nr:TetR/AcrR family transcriptional regulator [Agrococcus sp. ARC_14]MCH1883371.1 TetR/AcrR family transcriptional regulator [Agrococcus sp. ARC_14]
MSESHPYHHGDLPAALITAGLELARGGGPDAVSLREVTRRAGVTANAAYRHFADRRAFVRAVAERSQEDLALLIEREMDAAGSEADPARRALDRLRALGMAYVDFAVNEPGWFQLAFAGFVTAAPPSTARHTDNPNFRLLVAALDELVAAGMLSRPRRRNAEWACWSAVHGFAQLVTAGPLQGQQPAALRELGAHVVEVAIQGVISVPAPRSADRGIAALSSDS